MKRFTCLFISLFISIYSFADCSHIDCAYMPRVVPAIESHFSIPAGYEMAPANIGPSYSWGGNLNLANQNTELCCNDADQFFSVISTDQKKRCTIDSGIDFDGQYVTAIERNNLSTDSNMNCKISGGKAENNQYIYKITID